MSSPVQSSSISYLPGGRSRFSSVMAEPSRATGVDSVPWNTSLHAPFWTARRAREVTRTLHLVSLNPCKLTCVRQWGSPCAPPPLLVPLRAHRPPEVPVNANRTAPVAGCVHTIRYSDFAPAPPSLFHTHSLCP